MHAGLWAIRRSETQQDADGGVGIRPLVIAVVLLELKPGIFVVAVTCHLSWESLDVILRGNSDFLTTTAPLDVFD